MLLQGVSINQCFILSCETKVIPTPFLLREQEDENVLLCGLIDVLRIVLKVMSILEVSLCSIQER